MKNRYNRILSNILFILRNENLFGEILVEYMSVFSEKFTIDPSMVVAGCDFFPENTNAGIRADLEFIFLVFNLEEDLQQEEFELLCYYGIYSGLEVTEAFNYCCYLKEKSSYLNLCVIA